MIKKISLIIILLISFSLFISCNDKQSEEVKDFTVSFIIDNQKTDIKIQDGDKITKPTDPIKDGYTFIGWYSNNELYEFENPVYSNLTLEAKFKVIQYNVTFITDNDESKIIVNHGNKITKPTDPVKDGYTFIGWYSNNELYDFDNLVYSNLTLEAKFTLNVYDVTIILDDNEFKFNNINNLTVDNISQVDNYEYLGLYTDSLYQNEFNGIITSNITLYLKYNKYFNITIKTNTEDIKIKTYEGNKIDTTYLINNGYKNIILYTDENKTLEYDYKEVKEEITLYLDEGNLINIYDSSTLKERIILNKNQKLNKELYLNRYINYEFYLDEKFNEIYDFNNQITGDLTLYLKNINKDASKIKVQILRDDVIQIYYLEKGDTLNYADVVTTFNEMINDKNSTLYLYYDKECNYLFEYGPIYNDIILYGSTYNSETITDYSKVTIYGPQDNNPAYNIIIIDEGGIITEKEALITTGKKFDGYYYDKEFTKPYNYEPLYGEITLYIKTKEFTEEDNIHKITFYYHHTYYLYGLKGNLNKPLDIYLETYVEDGHIIYDNSYRKSGTEFAIHGLYNMKTNKIYNYEPITEDTEFLLLIIYMRDLSNIYEWKCDKLIFDKEYRVLYNDENNKDSIYYPNCKEKFVNIYFNNETYQIIVSPNTAITKDDITNIIGNNDFDFENLIITDDVIIYI